MPPPTHIISLIDEMLIAMQAHPEHQLNFNQRQALYQAFAMDTTEHGRKAQGWLAWIAANKVLPLFEEVLPSIPIPRRSLALANRVLQGTMRSDSPRIVRYSDMIYHASGNAWGRDPEELSWSAHTAGMAAYKALYEACGWDPFAHLPLFQRVSSFTYEDEVADRDNAADEAYSFDRFEKQLAHIMRDDAPDIGTRVEDLLNELLAQEVTHPQQPIPVGLHAASTVPINVPWSDEEFAQSAAIGDTAAAASVAMACSSSSPKCDPQKLRKFWEWWLIEAIPFAWEKASTLTPGSQT